MSGAPELYRALLPPLSPIPVARWDLGILSLSLRPSEEGETTPLSNAPPWTHWTDTPERSAAELSMETQTGPSILS